MSIRNRNIDRSWKVDTIWAKDFDFVLAEGTPNTLVSAQDSDGLLAELSTFGTLAVALSNAGDAIRKLYTIPSFVDVGYDLAIRVLWTSGSTTAADSVTWLPKYKYLSVNNDTFSATVDTALDTAIGADLYGATSAYSLRATPWGRISRATLQPSDPIMLEVEMDAKSGPTNVYFIGVQIAFFPSISTDVAPPNSARDDADPTF